MTGLIKSVRMNRERLEAITGPKPPPDPDAVPRWVEATRAGEIFFYTTQRIRVGRRGIDWSGGTA